MTLRRKIFETISNAVDDKAKAAIDVCVLLEEEIGLESSGWFHDDKVVTGAIKEFYDNKLTASAN